MCHFKVEVTFFLYFPFSFVPISYISMILSKGFLPFLLVERKEKYGWHQVVLITRNLGEFAIYFNNGRDLNALCYASYKEKK